MRARGAVLGLLLMAWIWSGPTAWGGELAGLETLAIQEEGRLKPLDTFAREAVLQVTGKERLGTRSHWDLFLSWLGNPGAFERDPVVRISHMEYKDALGLPREVQHFAARPLLENRWFKEWYGEVRRLRMGRREIPHDFRLQETEKLAGRLDKLYGITSLGALTVVPPAGTESGWRSIESVSGESGPLGGIRGSVAALAEAHARGDRAEFSRRTAEISTVLTAVNLSAYPADRGLAREVHYNTFKPFRKAWMCYLGALLLLIVSRGLAGRWLGIAGLSLYLSGFAVHTYGIILRSLIAGRPPVTNMYESVIWAAWGAVFFSSLFLLNSRRVRESRVFAVGASAAAVAALVLADNLPAVLNPAITPLEPVLRSNFWLTIHVLTITLSYAAFLLALGIGHVTLIQWWKSPGGSDRIRQLTEFVYRTLRIGVLLLAAGTILGGVWADYSWGRFWGWDPKEVWALIALLGYLAVLHGRYAGWLGPFGLTVGSVAGFLGILMAWYGVNFVLGVGLHSYGFGAGGVGNVAGFVLLDLGFVGLVAWRVKRGRRSTLVEWDPQAVGTDGGFAPEREPAGIR